MARLFALVTLFMAATSACFAGPFEDYTKIQKALIAQTVTAETVDAARKLFPNDAKFLESMDAVMYGLDRGQATLTMSGRYSKAYFEFIKLPASADVLAGFMESELARLKPALEGGKNKYQADVLSWGWSNIARAAILAYQRTGDERFIDMYARTVGWVFENLDSATATGGPDLIGADGWSLVDNGVAKRDVTTVGRITAPIIEMAIVTGKDERLSPDLRAKFGTYADRATEMLKSYLKHQVIEGKLRYFLFPWTGGQEAMNHMAAFAEACAFAYKRTGDTEFRAFPDGFLQYFRAHVTVGEDGSYSWPYQVGAENEHQEFFWKGAIVVGAMINIHASGIYLDDRDVRGLANSFDKYVLGEFYAINGYMGPRRFYMTGYNSFRLGYSSGLLFPQFILLDEWRPGTKDRVLEAIASRPDMFPTGFFIHSSDAVPYAYLLPRSTEKPSN